jgi:hypothetical protein
MTTWNYRIVRSIHKGEESFGIHEVYYENENPIMVTEEAVGAVGHTIEELADELGHMVMAFGKPILEYSEIGK